MAVFYSLKKVERELKRKKIVFAAWNAVNKNDSPYQNSYLPLKDIFGKVEVFDTAINYFRYGKKVMNHNLLNMVKKERPDYIFMILIYDEIDPLLLQEIKRVSPKTLLINLSSDDDWRFEDFSRYYCIFSDYLISNITNKGIERYYINDGIKNFSLSLGINCNLFKPLKIDKKYDVSFVGRPNKSRAELIKFLLYKGIKAYVWGDGWENYPEIKRSYQGHLSAENSVKVTNESKINLSFTKGGYGKMQMKGRMFEVGASKSFVLVEYFSVYKKYFKEGKEIIMFKNKKEMLNKINYYLRNEKEREKIAEAAYKKVIKRYNRHNETILHFSKILPNEKEIRDKRIPKLKRKSIVLSYNDFNLNNNELRKKLESFDYVSFNIGNANFHPLKNYFQQYSLEKSGKDISCCDYYASSPDLDNLLLFKAMQAFNLINKKSFDKCINLLQLMINKNYFLKNIGNFKRAADEKCFSLIDKNNTAFVSIPLVNLEIEPNIDYAYFRKAFEMKFLDMLYSLYYQKKLFFNSYIYKLIFYALIKNRLILRSLLENVTNKGKLSKLKIGF